MIPGDVVTCASCGAQAMATCTGGVAWQAGYPVSLIWTHGPHRRWEVTHVPPPECLWCKELHEATPGAEPLFRPAPGGASVPVPPPAPAENANERFDRLADAFYRETRIWPPGKDRPAAMGSDGVDEGERMARWREWCAARAHAAIEHVKAKPKKGAQLGLF